MILQALNDYYERKAADPGSGIAPQGFEYKEIPFILVIDRPGNLVNIEDTRQTINKKIRARSFLVPQGEKRASNVKANLLWDNTEYLFGIPVKGKPERVVQQHQAFIERVKSLIWARVWPSLWTSSLPSKCTIRYNGCGRKRSKSYAEKSSSQKMNCTMHA